MKDSTQLLLTDVMKDSTQLLLTDVMKDSTQLLLTDVMKDSTQLLLTVHVQYYEHLISCIQCLLCESFIQFFYPKLSCQSRKKCMILDFH